MKTILQITTVVIIMVIIMGCSSSQSNYEENNNVPNISNEPQRSHAEETSRMQTKEEVLLKMGLSLEGENVLNPLRVKPGDLIQGLKVVEIQAFQGTPDYVLDTVFVEFSGSITLTGTVKYLPEDKNFGSDQMVVFEVNALEERNLPISHHDRWEQVIMFKNREEASSSLQIKPGDVRENVTILLEDYKYAFLPTEAISTADFVRIIDEK